MIESLRLAAQRIADDYSALPEVQAVAATLLTHYLALRGGGPAAETDLHFVLKFNCIPWVERFVGAQGLFVGAHNAIVKQQGRSREAAW